MNFSQEWDNDPLIVFPPVVEEAELEEEPFIMDLRYKKHSLDVPWLVGMTSEEGLIKTAGFCTFFISKIHKEIKELQRILLCF